MTDQWVMDDEFVKIAKVKGHATDEMVEDGRVRWQDKGGHEAAGGAVDYGRRR